MHPHDGIRPPAATFGPQRDRRLARGSRFILVALASAALMVPALSEASAQFGMGGLFGRGQGFPGTGAMRGPAPAGTGLKAGAMRGPQGMGFQGAATRVPGARVPGLQGSATRGPGLQGSGPRGPGLEGVPGVGRGGIGRPGIIGVPPLLVPPYVGPSGPVEVVEDDLPPPRRAGGAGRKPPGSGKTAQQPPAGRAVSGMPPAGELRFVPDHLVVVLRADVTDRQLDAFLRQNRLARTAGGDQRIALIDARVARFRIVGGRSVRTVIPELARNPLVVGLQPDYLYGFAQVQEAAAAADPNAASAPAGAPKEEAPARDPTIERLQYAVGKLKLPQAHKVARGGQVVVAVIDSRIDAAHPELAGAVVREIDVLDDKDGKPHSHGTAMAGAIVAKARLMGVAPDAQVIAVRAFSVTSAGAAASTSFALMRGLDGAVAEGARIINLSFAGPADPLLSRASRPRATRAWS